MITKVSRAARLETGGKERRRAGAGALRLLMPAGAAAAGAVTAVSEILGFPSFLGAAAAALSGNYGLWVFAGALTGHLFGTGLERGIVQLCSILVICAIRAIDPFGERRDDPVYMGLTVTSVLILFSAVMSAARPDVYSVSMRMLSSLACGGLTFSARLIIRDVKQTGILRLTGPEGMVAGMVYMTVIGTLATLRLGRLIPARMLAAALVLWAAKRYRSRGGALMGAMSACGIMLCYPDLGRGTLILAVAGLIAGAFSVLGTGALTVSFLMTLTAGLAAVGQLRSASPMLLDGVCGTVIFAAIPSTFLSRLGRRLRYQSSAGLVSQTHAAQLRMAGMTLGDIRHRLEQVTDTLDRSTAGLALEQEVERCVCADCQSYGLCYRQGSGTADRLRSLTGLLRDRGRVEPVDAAAAVPGCARPVLLADAFCELGMSIAEDRSDNKKMRELRGVLIGQLDIMERVLEDLARPMSQGESPDPAMSERIRELLVREGCRGARAAVSCGADSPMRAEVFVSGAPTLDGRDLAGALSDILECDMSEPAVTREGGVTRLSFSELPRFTAETASFSASAGGALSGDSFASFNTGGSESYVILSDGMGTGKRAGLDSGFTVTLCRRLLCAGLSPETVHSLVNSILRVKGWEESFATLDMLRLDLCSGRAMLLKSGAATSRLIRDGGFASLGGQAFPVGILDSCEPDITELKLFDGDILLMMSDGVDEDTADELCRMAGDSAGTDLEELVRRLGSSVMDRYADRRRDDVTLLAVRIVLDR